jgi:predicted permease
MRWHHRLFRRRLAEKHIDAELRFHLDQQIADYIAAGMAPDEAHRRASLGFGGLDQVKEECRDIGAARLIETLIQDVRYGLRQLRHNPGFTAVAVMTLALGIAANATIFSVISLVLLKKPPVRNPDRVMMLTATNPQKGWDLLHVSVLNFEAFRKQNHVFKGMAAVDADDDFTLTGQGTPEHLTGMQVTANYFKVLGLTPALGRDFASSENEAGHNHVVILSDRLWKQHFGSNGKIIGTEVEIDGQPSTVIGVMPPGTEMPLFMPQLWTPIVFTAKDLSPAARNSRWLYVFARLKTGITIKAAQAEATTIAARIAQDHPATEKGWGAHVLSLQAYMIDDANIRAGLSVLMGAVAFVLLIACANVAGLLLARATGRQHEIAIRAALGAGRARVIRQLLVESSLIALAGGGLGLLLSYWGIDLLRMSLSWNFYAVFLGAGIHLDGRTLLFSIALTLATALLFGLAPALRISKPDLTRDLKEGGRTGTGGLERNRMRSVLVVVEIALSVVLLTGAGLFMQGFIWEIRMNPGFNPKHLLTAQISLSSLRYKDNPAKQAAFYERVTQHLRNLPGVESACAAQRLPLGGYSRRTVGLKSEPKSEWPLVGTTVVGPSYFRTMQIPLMRGRVFSTMDTENSPRVALVNRAFAQRYFPKGDAIGQSILPYTLHPAWAEIVGIVGNVKEYPGQAEDDPQVYESYRQDPSASMALVMRTRNASAGLAPALRRAVWDVDMDQPVGDIITMAQISGENTGGDLLMCELMGAFAGLALVLSAVGIYGVIAYAVAQRTHEIGIRMALGAQKNHVLALLLRQGGLVTAIGCAAGLALALPMPRLFSAMFNGGFYGGPLTVAAVGSAVAIVSLLATYIPARRAARVNPIVALRYE